MVWPAIAEELEELYQAQGCPPLDGLVFPNRDGAYRRWDNFRDRTSYGALHRAIDSGCGSIWTRNSISARVTPCSERPLDLANRSQDRLEVAFHTGAGRPDLVLQPHSRDVGDHVANQLATQFVL